MIMPTFSDAAGFKYMGDCQWGTLNINYPTQYYLEANPHSLVSADLTSLCTDAGLAFRNVAAQSLFNNYPSNLSLLYYGANGDIDDRYVPFIANFFVQNASQGVYLYNNSGAVETTNNVAISYTNHLTWVSQNGINTSVQPVSFNYPSATQSSFQWVGASDGQYLALFLLQRNFANSTSVSSFFYGGLVANANTNYNYYSANNISRSVIFCNMGVTSLNTVGGAHYIANTAKNLLQTGDAAYSIVCSDSQTPTAQWATDFYAFDDNSSLGFPAIGRVRGMLLGTGTYTLGKPVKIAGSVFPDGGSPWYIPVGTYANKTLLMRCYSSMV